MEIFISPKSTNVNTPLPHDFATKIRLFWERFDGWKFKIAQQMLDGFEKDGAVYPGIEHSGYAALDVMFSYFEPLGKHLEGYLDPGGNKMSGHHFKIGAKHVFSLESHPDQVTVDAILKALWSGVRCGIYHAGQTKGKVLISGETEKAISFSTSDQIAIINPHLLAEGLRVHVAQYRDDILAAGEHSILGRNFIARYDYDNPV